MNDEIKAYNQTLQEDFHLIGDRLAQLIDEALPNAESKIWHRHPVWFLEGNPTVGYSVQKLGVRLMFWSGADFGEEGLNVHGQKFKDASIFFQQLSEIDEIALKRWLQKATEIQWDYKNLIKRRGELVRLT